MYNDLVGAVGMDLLEFVTDTLTFKSYLEPCSHKDHNIIILQ